MLSFAMLRLTWHESDAMCPGNDILVILVDFVETRFFKALNTMRNFTEPTLSRLSALWGYFTRQWMQQARQLVLDMCLTTATSLFVKIPKVRIRKTQYLLRPLIHA